MIGEVIEENQAEAYLEVLNERWALPNSQVVSEMLAGRLAGEKALVKL